MLRAYARYAGPADSESALLQRHGPLIDRCARRLAARSGHAVQAEDLWSAGAMGLLDAARRFDAGRDVRFETFAEHRIRGAMLDEMRRMDHLPRRLRAETDKVEAARAKLGHTLGREPEVEEVAAEVGGDLADVAELLHLLQPMVPIQDEVAAAPLPPVDDVLAVRQAQDRLARAIGALPERLQLLLALYYDEELTYREIAKIMGVSEPRVCQLHSEAVKRLREAMAEASPRPAA